MTEYDAYFSGLINKSALGQELLSEIESISDIVPLIWAADVTYESGQTVVHNGKIWLWTDAVPGNEEPPGTKWKSVGDAVAEAGALAGRIDQLELDVTEVDGKVTAVGNRVDGLVAQYSAERAGDGDWNAGDEDAFAGTIITLTVIASGDYALGRRVDTTEAAVGETRAMVQATSQALVDLDGQHLFAVAKIDALHGVVPSMRILARTLRPVLRPIRKQPDMQHHPASRRHTDAGGLG